jgi:lysozyme
MMRLVNMLKRHEGVRDKVYMCSAGYETIGVGRNISESGLGLSNDEIEYLLRTTLSDAETSYWVSTRGLKT